MQNVLVFKIAILWKYIIFACSLSILLLGGAFAFRPFLEVGYQWGDELFFDITGLIFVFLALITPVSMYFFKVVVTDETTIRTHGLLGMDSRELRLDNIAGYTIGNYVIRIEPVVETEKPVVISKYISQDFYDWLYENVPNMANSRIK